MKLESKYCYLINAFTEPNFSILPVWIPFPKIGTTPTEDPVKTQISNKKLNQIVNGNTNTVYKNPLNSLRFVLNKIKKDKINLNKDFWVFTGSSVGVVPILGKGIYTGKIEKLGSVKALIR